MEIEKKPFIFQIDADIVKKVYSENDNFKITYNHNIKNRKICAIYFSRNTIYYPNRLEVFNKRIIEKNSFEWLSNNINHAYKNIYIRDIHKQWYLNGINEKINSPEGILDFLKEETKGFEIVTLGTASGGYAAVLFGSLLKAKKVLTFNGPFEIKSLLKTSNPLINPLLFKNQNTPLFAFYDLRNFINPSVPIYYFLSSKSARYASDINHIKDFNNIKTISFRTGQHGIPFLKVALKPVMHLENRQLNKLARSTHFPVLFSIRMAGLLKTLNGLYSQISTKLKKPKK